MLQNQIPDFSGSVKATLMQPISRILTYQFKHFLQISPVFLLIFFRCRNTKRLGKILLMKPIRNGKLPDLFRMI